MWQFTIFSPNGKERTHSIETDGVSIGREEDNQIVLNDERVSRYHARVVRKNRSWWVEDLDSSNGVLVEGNPIQKSRLKNGAAFEIVDHRFVLTRSGDDGALAKETEDKQAVSDRQNKEKAVIPGARPEAVMVAIGEEAVLKEVRPAIMPASRERVSAKDEGAAMGDGKPSVEIVTQKGPRLLWLTGAIVGFVGVVIAILALRQEGSHEDSQGLVRVGDEDESVSVESPSKAVLESASDSPEGNAKETSAADRGQDKVGTAMEPPKAKAESMEWKLVDQFPVDADTRRIAFSPDLMHVISCVFRSGGARGEGIVDVMVDGLKVHELRGEIEEVTPRFSPDGTNWMVQARDLDGNPVLAMADRLLTLEGEPRQIETNRDFSQVGCVIRVGNEDRFYLNGKHVDSYSRIRDLKVSERGGRWAYIAAKVGVDSDSGSGSESAKVRVVSDRGAGSLCDEVKNLSFSADGSRMAHVEIIGGGGSTLMLDGEVLLESEGGEFLDICFSSVGSNVSHLMRTVEGRIAFGVEGREAWSAELEQNVDPAVGAVGWISKSVSAGRIVYSSGGDAVACLVQGGVAMVFLNGVQIASHPRVDLESARFSPDGECLAYVAMTDLSEVAEGGGGLLTQSGSESLFVGGTVIDTVRVEIIKSPMTGAMKLGGLSRVQFSPSGRRVAYVMDSYRDAQREQVVRVNGESPHQPGGDLGAIGWTDESTLRLVSRFSNGAPVVRLVSVKAESE